MHLPGREGSGKTDVGGTDEVAQHENSTLAMDRANSVWSQVDRSEPCLPDQIPAGHDLKKAFAAARKSQSTRQEAPEATLYHLVDPALYIPQQFSADDVDHWFEKHAASLNEEQTAFLRMVARHALQELAQPSMESDRRCEPLRWLLHGKPGTGKSHTIKKLCTFFDEVMGYTANVHYKVAALQATMAAQIRGDTLHHALHIPMGSVFTKSDTSSSTGQARLAREIVLWRWFVIDEISMVSGRFLADIDLRLRSATRSIGTMKHDDAMHERSFGGLNMLFAGDWWQLDPPESCPQCADMRIHIQT